MNIQNIIHDFITKIKNNEIEIYNESSIQHELAIFLRQELKDYYIQLERNISYFNLDKQQFEKKEIDLVIFNEDKSVKTAIELKFPKNGQYPEQMFSFCKDMKFLEQLRDNGFQNNLFIAFADDNNFWNDKGKEGTIYYKFRNTKTLSGQIIKPTGTKDKIIELNGEYKIEWMPIGDTIKCFVVEI